MNRAITFALALSLAAVSFLPVPAAAEEDPPCPDGVGVYVFGSGACVTVCEDGAGVVVNGTEACVAWPDCSLVDECVGAFLRSLGETLDVECTIFGIFPQCR